MGVGVEIRFRGDDVTQPQYRDLVEHIAAVVNREVGAYAKSHGGEGALYPPVSVRDVREVDGLGAAAAGTETRITTQYEARATGYVILPHAGDA